jgi:hypothetical protein
MQVRLLEAGGSKFFEERQGLWDKELGFLHLHLYPTLAASLGAAGAPGTGPGAAAAGTPSPQLCPSLAAPLAPGAPGAGPGAAAAGMPPSQPPQPPAAGEGGGSACGAAEDAQAAEDLALMVEGTQ